MFAHANVARGSKIIIYKRLQQQLNNKLLLLFDCVTLTVNRYDVIAAYSRVPLPSSRFRRQLRRTFAAAAAVPNSKQTIFVVTFFCFLLSLHNSYETGPRKCAHNESKTNLYSLPGKTPFVWCVDRGKSRARFVLVYNRIYYDTAV